MIPDLTDPVQRVIWTLKVYATAPQALGGIWLRARPGPVREAVLSALSALRPRRIHPSIDDDSLFGGLDVAATLASGHAIRARGVLAVGQPLQLAMAERTMPGLAAKLGQALDTGRTSLIAIDEGADDDEGLPPVLVDRLGLLVSLDGFRKIDLPALGPERDIGQVRVDRAHVTAVTTIAAKLGIASMRAPLLALSAARALALLDGRNSVGEADVAQAANLVFAHRAAPFSDEAPPPAEPDAAPDTPPPDSTRDDPSIPDDLIVEAVRAALPADLLAQLAAGRATRAAHGARGTGAAKRGNRRGRPLPARAGRLGGDARIDLVATLRAAAPWQTIRRRSALMKRPVYLRSADIRTKRFQETSDRLLIFVVDASGSAAMARLAEAKGAVELLLASAYARRDHVALIAFRGPGAELLLPPSRSLIQTKRRLAALPGGGGTP